MCVSVAAGGCNPGPRLAAGGTDQEATHAADMIQGKSRVRAGRERDVAGSWTG